MKMTMFKVIMFFIAFIFVQGTILPWVISNDILPLWMDILIISLLMGLWVILVEYIALGIVRRLRKPNETR